MNVTEPEQGYIIYEIAEVLDSVELTTRHAQALRAKTEALIAERRQPRGSRRRRISFALLGAVAAATTITGGLAIAGVIDIPVINHARDDAPAVDDSSLPPISKADAKVLQNVLDDIPPRNQTGGLDVGPAPADIIPAHDGRVLVNDAASGRLSAVPTRRGDVCIVMSTDDRPLGVSCIGELDELGLGYFEMDNQYGHFVGGLATDEIRTVEVLADGQYTTATVRNNAFVWRSDSTPSAIRVIKTDGSVQGRSLSTPPQFPRAKER